MNTHARPWFDDEDHLLAAIADTVDPLPIHVLAAWRASFVWRTVDTELTTLLAAGSRDFDARGATDRPPGQKGRPSREPS